MNEKPRIKRVIQRCGCDAILPFALVYVFYIILHGHLSPGGGFQGGSICATFLALMLIAHGSDYINECAVSKQLNGDGVTQIQFLFETCELGQVSLGRYSGFLEVSHQRCRGILLLCLLITELDSAVAILLHTFHLSNNTRTYFDNSAWYVLTLGTEYGCHSDFLS